MSPVLRIPPVLLSLALVACGGSSSETPYPLEPAPHKATNKSSQEVRSEKQNAAPAADATSDEAVPSEDAGPAGADY